MPAIMTHFAFAKMRAEDNIDNDVLYLGAQGPDVFFFYGYTLKKRNNIKDIRAFGTHLHHIDISKAYFYLLKYAEGKKDREKEILNTFIHGLFLHYIMDRNCHPYVFYRTGFSDKDEDKKYFFASHASYESYIDTLIRERFNLKVAPRKAIRADKTKVMLISKMMSNLAKDIFNNEIIKENSYYLAWKDMKFCQIIFYSPLGVKKSLFRLIAPKGAINAMTTPRKVKHNDLLDVLNDNKSEWRDCVTNKVHHDSFLELIATASNEVDRLEQILAGQYREEDIKRFVANTDHDGFEVDSIKKYYESIWDKVPNLRW